MKKTNKILIVLIIIFFMMSICGQVFAIDPEDYEPTPPTVEESKILVNKVGIILRAVRNIGAVVSVITLMIIGVKYMLGSVEEKANYKATMWPYVIGCIMIVGGTIIVSFIYEAFK